MFNLKELQDIIDSEPDTIYDAMLYRKYGSYQTDGWLVVDEHRFRTLELVWLDNKRNVSCIPEGIYTVSYDDTGRHRWFKVNDVENRTFIEIHQASKPSHLQGCIGFYRNSDLIKLSNFFGKKDWTLKITSETGYPK